MIFHLKVVCFSYLLQFCLKLSVLASLPASFGGLDGQVVYIDLELKFSSKRYPTQPLV